MSWFVTGPLVGAAALVFLAGAAWRIAALLRMPPHLRWDLYPIPRRGPEGSKYQQANLAGRHPRDHRLAEALFMAEEIFLLRKVFAQRKALWIGSMLLHAGLYAAIGWAVLLLVPQAAGPASWLGLVATVAGLAGAVWLFVLRLADRNLRVVSDVVSYLNLALLGAMFAAGLAAFVSSGSVHAASRTAAIALAALFVAYLPYGRMFHAPIKFFTYHEVFWDDERIASGGRLEKRIAARLGDATAWSAAHLRAGATWSELAAPPVKEDADGV